MEKRYTGKLQTIKVSGRKDNFNLSLMFFCKRLGNTLSPNGKGVVLSPMYFTAFSLHTDADNTFIRYYSGLT